MLTRTKLRDLQIILTAKIFRALGMVHSGRRFIEGVRSTHFGSVTLGWLLGYRRSFRSLGEAEKAVSPYAKGGHENPTNAAQHLELNRIARPSDYAAFYYLKDRMPMVRTIFDLGGNVGNLYYCYKNYLPLREDVVWTVYDLPEHIQRGQALARDKGVTNLLFTDDWQQASGVDLFIASGSLHYFDKPLPDLIATLAERPKAILINRTPMTEGPAFAVVQDAGHLRVACMLYNRADIVAAFERLGYRAGGEWQAPELRLPVVDHPSANVGAYTGLWFERLEA